MTTTEKTSENSTLDATIAALLNQIAADACRCADEAMRASALMAAGNRNGAVGTLLSIEAELDRLASLKTSVLALHRAS
jgi:hypothetical protein